MMKLDVVMISTVTMKWSAACCKRQMEINVMTMIQVRKTDITVIRCFGPRGGVFFVGK